MKVKFALALFSLLLALVFSAGELVAQADDLIIAANGAVTVIITENSGVLAATTEKETKKVEAPKKLEAPAKTVPLVSANTPSTVRVTPPANDQKKIQVTITKRTETPASQETKKSGSVVTRVVDQVVEQGTGNKPVVSITSKRANELTISQGEAKVSTNLPLQIDTTSHTISVALTPDQPTRVSVLPSEATQGIINSGLLNKSSLGNATVTLSQDGSGVNYTASGVRSGKLFGLVGLSSPVQVKLSAQSGRVVQTSQSLLFQTLGFWIK